MVLRHPNHLSTDIPTVPYLLKAHSHPMASDLIIMVLVPLMDLSNILHNNSFLLNFEIHLLLKNKTLNRCVKNFRDHNLAPLMA
jgi:hypothetical protein